VAEQRPPFRERMEKSGGLPKFVVHGSRSSFLDLRAAVERVLQRFDASLRV
jgi:hypothetical protein